MRFLHVIPLNENRNQSLWATRWHPICKLRGLGPKLWPQVVRRFSCWFSRRTNTTNTMTPWFSIVMSSNSQKYYRSQSLNAQWEDLSQSVANLLQDHENQSKAEVSLQSVVDAQHGITTCHWANEQGRSRCSASECQKKFSLTERKHHCRRWVQQSCTIFGMLLLFTNTWYSY